VADRLLDVRNLRTSFFGDEGEVAAVDGVSFHVDRGETVGIVGESGCGKSVTSLSIMRLVPEPPGRIVDGAISFEGENLLALTERKMREIRGNKIAMIYQEPMTSLNPVYTVGSQIAEAVRRHRGVSRAQASERALEMLRLAGISAPERRMSEYPHQLSGGMRQRVMIAMALSCDPRLLIADEPTTALDVTIQAQILDLLKRLKRQSGMSLILITHDLGIVAEMCDRVIVMYGGRVVEQGDVRSIFANPLHPYTEGLLNSIPRIDRPRDKLLVIEGSVPHPRNLPPGCRFAPRCRRAFARCRSEQPGLEEAAPGRAAACFLATERLGGAESTS
jgi:oligopeptide/dipeptide ABC transporter ATP-binding protein